MEGAAAALGISSPKTHLRFNVLFPSSSSPRITHIVSLHPKPSCGRRVLLLSSKTLLAETVKEEVGEEEGSRKYLHSKLDKMGRFCSPRAARELALVISYAACLEGVDPVRLFDQRVNAKRIPGYQFDKAWLLEYDHMSFGGAPIGANTEEEAEELTLKNEKQSANEAAVLLAPPRLVYNRLILKMARGILVAVLKQWNDHVKIIEKITPSSWKDEPAARILEFCILHQAMAEITVMGTRHQIVINESVDLAKRFCDGCAPRIINGCLRTFVNNHIPGQKTRE